jgi:hypothetical protein
MKQENRRKKIIICISILAFVRWGIKFIFDPSWKLLGISAFNFIDITLKTLSL